MRTISLRPLATRGRPAHAEPLEVEGDGGEPEGAKPPHDLVPQGGRPLHLRGLDLDPHHLPVVASPTPPKPQGAELALGRRDRAELLGGNRLAVGDPRGQTRLRGRVPHTKAVAPRQAPHVVFAKTSRQERVYHPVLGGRTEARPIVVEVVFGGAVGEGGEATLADHAEHAPEELVFTEIAALARVRGERGALKLVGLDTDVRDVEPLREAAGGGGLARRTRRRDGGEGEHPVRAERGRGRGQHEARIHAAGEGDAHRAQLRQLSLEPPLQLSDVAQLYGSASSPKSGVER